MAKKLSKIRRLATLGILVPVLVAATVPHANAGVLDRIFSFAFDIAAYDQDPEHQSLYLVPSPNIESPQWLDPNPVIIDGNFLITNSSPTVIKANIPKLSNNFAIREIMIPVTAYSSTPDQTDDSPFVTAWGTRVRDGIVATNFLPFGTKIKIPEAFGDKIFVVEDRMNKRYWQKVDIWFPDRQSASGFGLKILKIQILES